MLKENEKIIKVCFQNSSLNGFDKYKTRLYIVDTKLESDKNSIILIQPILDYNKKDEGIALAKVLKTYEDEDAFYKEYDEIQSIDDIKKPFFVCNLNLDPYYQSVRECTRKIELEKQMKKAASKLEDIAKYKALADIDPSFKPLYEEYLSICQTENKTLLEASNDNSTNDNSIN